MKSLTVSFHYAINSYSGVRVRQRWRDKRISYDKRLSYHHQDRTHKIDGRTHRIDGPAYTVIHKNYTRREWWREGRLV
jgi:hypothetical protein